VAYFWPTQRALTPIAQPYFVGSGERAKASALKITGTGYCFRFDGEGVALRNQALCVWQGLLTSILFGAFKLFGAFEIGLVLDYSLLTHELEPFLG
jgi:hypothetical protein